MRRFALTPARLLAAATAAVAALSLSASAASAADVPDPLAAGPHPTKKIDYEAGSMLLTLADGVSTTPVPLRGSITYADDVDFADIVVFVHGRHGVCIGTPTAPRQICDDVTDPDGTPTQSDVRSYGGYDYMAKNLASHGYTVMSLEANTSNFDNNWRDGGANARSQIIQANLELLWRWNNAAGPYVAGEPDHTVGTKLVGRLNFAEGIGLMGHSRGGDAVTDFIGYTRNLRVRSGFQRISLAGVLALAPVNYTANKMPYGTNYGVLLPACDGDVSTLQGARFFENAKYPTDTGQTTDTFAKVQWYVQGTNHNFYNTVWTQDDFGSTTDPACSRGLDTSARLTPADQRRVGAALMNSFMRRYVGNERAFDPVMTGEVTLQETAAPLESGKGLAEEVKTSYVAPLSKRFDLLRPKSLLDPQPDPSTGGVPTPFDATLTTTTASGGPITPSGLTAFQVCNPNDLAYRQGPTFPTSYPLCPEGALNRSKGNQFNVAWDGPAKLTVRPGRAGAPVDLSAYGVLDLRTAINRNDPRNPAGDGYTPNAVTQDFTVTVTDASGTSGTTNVARWSTALEPSIGRTYQHIVLNGVRIPLTAFGRVNLTRVVAVELGFGQPGSGTPALGSIQLADVMFQESPLPAAPGGGAVSGPQPDPVGDKETVVPGPDGPPSTPPGPIVDVPVTSAPTTGKACVDTTKPTVKLTRVARAGTTLRLSGSATDSGCAGGKGVASGGVARTSVQLFRLAGKGKARFVTARGLLSKPLPRTTGIAIPAKGSSSWSLTVKTAKLPKGSYRLKVSTYDKTGNTRTLTVRVVTVR
ncbi:hypothetical protein Q5424_13680 [Conexibacter sp. JD483]|uniref:hypothetical protein n=1 Tax=unclassified Conexibacter TaxID=2627773 RepID=UPI00271A487D|nr:MULTISPECIES: hypothetical protein [unclassified Conexibacter]MDO8188275.1 hypothetical protein [Conexibacter sp. CPCC 205706]MDO8197370.1 hypothetical protein [Conexibacter sp. CPCC 205762]MDR9370146.1 hypothetical protein [Conexibacter sp. JD483]